MFNSNNLLYVVRNLVRKTKRSALLVLSVFWLVLLNLLMQAQQNGTHQHILSNFLGFYAGYLSIQPKDTAQVFFNNNEVSFIGNHSVSFIEKALPRLEIFAILQSKHKSKPIVLSGVVIQEEKNIFQPSKYLLEGSYFENDEEKSVLISQVLAKKLNLSLHQKILLSNNNTHSFSSKDSFIVKGIFQFPSPELNKKQVFIPLKTLQNLFNVSNKISSISIFPSHHSPHLLDKLKTELQRKLQNTDLEVKTWRENFPELSQTFHMDYWVGYLILSILYLITVLGFWGIVLMIFQERENEWTMLWKLGVTISQITRWVMTEISILITLGALLGCSFAFLISKWIENYPIRLTGEWATSLENLGFEPLITYSFEAYPLFFQLGLLAGMIVLLTLYLRWKLIHFLRSNK